MVKKKALNLLTLLNRIANSEEIILPGSVYNNQGQRTLNDVVSYYEIKIRRILWDEANCFAIILSNITEKENVTNL